MGPHTLCVQWRGLEWVVRSLLLHCPVEVSTVNTALVSLPRFNTPMLNSMREGARDYSDLALSLLNCFKNSLQG